MAALPKTTFEVRHDVDIDWESLDTWTQQQMMELLSFAEQHRWSIKHISEQQSRVLDKVVAIWHVTFESHHKLKLAWMITGDLLTDVLPVQNIANAREALLFFSRKYLSRAQYLRNKTLEDPEITDSMEVCREKMEALVKASADLLVLYHEKQLWN